MNRSAFGLMAIAGLLAFTSCSSDMPDDISTPSNGDNVEFRIEIPTELGSRAGFYGDGIKANINTLTYSLFRVENNGELVHIKDVTKEITSITYGIDAVHMSLLKGYAYQVAFFAGNTDKSNDSNNSKFINYNEGKITLDYSKNEANNADNDVFVGHSKVFKVEEGYTEIVKLTRPFAQLNWGVSDLQDPSLDPYRSAITATVKISSGMLYSQYNVIEDKVVPESQIEEETSFPAYYVSNCPSIKDVEFPVTNEAKPYQLLNMHYMLVGDKGSTTGTNGKIALELRGCSKDIDITVANAPLIPNYRTNIYGDLFTAPTKVNMSVNSSYSGSSDSQNPVISTDN